MDDFTSEVAIQAQKARLLKVLTAFKKTRPERLAVVQVHDLGELPQSQAGPPERAGNASHVLRRHDFPAQRVATCAVEEQQQRHARWIAGVGIDCLEIQCMPVRNHHIAHVHQGPVTENGQRALVVPCLAAFPEQCPFIEAFPRIGVDPAPDGVFGRGTQPFGLAALLDAARALTDLRRVGMEHLPQDDGLVLLREHGLALVGKAALVRQSQDALGAGLFQLPPFDALPAYAGAEFGKQLAPGSALISENEVLLLFNGRAELCLPIQIQAHKVGLRQRPVTALVVKQGLLRQRGKLRDGGFGKGGNGFKGAAFFGATDGQLRFFRHAGRFPYISAPATLPLSCGPAFPLRAFKRSPVRESQQGCGFVSSVCFLKSHNSPIQTMLPLFYCGDRKAMIPQPQFLSTHSKLFHYEYGRSMLRKLLVLLRLLFLPSLRRQSLHHP